MASQGMTRPASEQTLYFMGGLPKSGTSALAGALYTCGLPMDIITETGHQPLYCPKTTNIKTDEKYHMYETPSVMTVNEQLLRGVVSGFEHQGTLVAPGIGSMLNPPHSDCIYNDLRTASLASYILSMVPEFPFGIKDPRFAVLFGTWKYIFSFTHPKISLEPIFSVREPLAAASALVRRKWMPSMEAALEVWLRYNTRVLKWHEIYDAKIILFDSSTAYLSQIESLTEMMGLNYDEDALQAFFQPTIAPEVDRTHLHEHPMRSSIEDTYRKLVEARIETEGDSANRLRTG